MSTMSFELNFKTENENKMEKLESARTSYRAIYSLFACNCYDFISIRILFINNAATKHYFFHHNLWLCELVH